MHHSHSQAVASTLTLKQWPALSLSSSGQHSQAVAGTLTLKQWPALALSSSGQHSHSQAVAITFTVHISRAPVPQCTQSMHTCTSMYRVNAHLYLNVHSQCTPVHECLNLNFNRPSGIYITDRSPRTCVGMRHWFPACPCSTNLPSFQFPHPFLYEFLLPLLNASPSPLQTSSIPSPYSSL